MPNEDKKWLVRTRGGDFLGPYTESELISEVNAGVFFPDDEIAPSGGYWISAQKLVNREDTEFTRTSTRHTNTTKSISIAPDTEITSADLVSPQPSPPPAQGNLAPQATAPQPMPEPRPPKPSPPARRPVLALLIVALVLVVAVLIRIVSKTPDPGPDKVPVNLSTLEDSPFVRKINNMIIAGDRQPALSLLTRHHQNTANKKDLGYLIPYAALLITEEGFDTRARNLLNSILETNRASRHLKSMAHRWLGYIQLSNDEGDLGVTHFLQALLLDPKDTAAKFNLGRAYLKQERPKDALDYFKLAELESPDLWLIHIFKGHAKVELNRNDEARYSLKRASEISKERWLAYVYYGLFLTGVVQERKEASKIMQEMLTKDPFHEINNPPPFGYFFVEENYGDYLNAFEKIMAKASPKLLELGRLYIRYLANGPGSREGKRILKLSKNGGVMTKVVALKVLLDNNAPNKALEAQLKRLPQNLESFGYYAYVLRGEALLKIGQTEAAGENLKRALFLGPKTAVSRLSYAEWLRRTGKKVQAEEQLRKILTYHPNYIPAIRSLRRLHQPR